MDWRTLTERRISIIELIIVGILYGGVNIAIQWYYAGKDLQLRQELANLTKRFDELQIKLNEIQIKEEICQNSKLRYLTIRNRITDCGKLNTLNKTEIKELNLDLNYVIEAQSLLELDYCSEGNKILDNITIPKKCYEKQTNLPTICGNGICEQGENSTSCLSDCVTTTAKPYIPTEVGGIPVFILVVIIIIVFIVFEYFMCEDRKLK
jgi:hypothetical protein